MNEKPPFTRSSCGGVSYEAWLYELAAMHRKLDSILRMVGDPRTTDEQRKRFFDSYDQGRLFND